MTVICSRDVVKPTPVPGGTTRKRRSRRSYDYPESMTVMRSNCNKLLSTALQHQGTKAVETHLQNAKEVTLSLSSLEAMISDYSNSDHKRAISNTNDYTSSSNYRDKKTDTTDDNDVPYIGNQLELPVDPADVPEVQELLNRMLFKKSVGCPQRSPALADTISRHARRTVHRTAPLSARASRRGASMTRDILGSQCVDVLLSNSSHSRQNIRSVSNYRVKENKTTQSTDTKPIRPPILKNSGNPKGVVRFCSNSFVGGSSRTRNSIKTLPSDIAAIKQKQIKKRFNGKAPLLRSCTDLGAADALSINEEKPKISSYKSSKDRTKQEKNSNGCVIPLSHSKYACPNTDNQEKSQFRDSFLGVERVISSNRRNMRGRLSEYWRQTSWLIRCLHECIVLRDSISAAISSPSLFTDIRHGDQFAKYLDHFYAAVFELGSPHKLGSSKREAFDAGIASVEKWCKSGEAYTKAITNALQQRYEEGNFDMGLSAVVPTSIKLNTIHIQTCEELNCQGCSYHFPYNKTMCHLDLVLDEMYRAVESLVTKTEQMLVQSEK